MTILETFGYIALVLIGVNFAFGAFLTIVGLTAAIFGDVRKYRAKLAEQETLRGKAEPRRERPTPDLSPLNNAARWD